MKAPKIYFRDSGILHALIGINDNEQLQIHPKLGSFWEGFALEEGIRTLNVSSEECYFWATHSEGALDLLIIKNETGDVLYRSIQIIYKKNLTALY